MQNKKNIGLIGLGYWGKNILRNLADLGMLHTACDSSGAVISEKKVEYPDLIFTDKITDIMRSPEITGVAIASPAVTHYDIAKQALESDKDVFVEKPLALTVAEGQELINLANKNNRVLMVGHILQYHPALIRLKDMISAGSLGKIQYIYSNRLNIGKLRTEEDILWSFAPHDISAMLMLFGEEPIKIGAFGGDFLNRGIYDTTLTTLEFKNGVKGHIFVSWLHPYKEQKLVVVGSEGMVVFNDMSQEKLCIYPHKIEWIQGKVPLAQKAQCEVIDVQDKEPLREELLHFYECVTRRQNPRTDGEEGLRVLKIIEEAEKSLTETHHG
ncbi:Gfo/Idh/MocA family protein [Candidatus Omnitrophota bacterium]